MNSDMKKVTYKCSQCGAEMKLKLFPDEQPAAALGCQNCKAGFGLTDTQQLNSRQGMFPVEVKMPDEAEVQADREREGKLRASAYHS